MPAPVVADVLEWVAPVPDPGALPNGWTDAAVSTVTQMAERLGVPLIEILALFESESGMNVHSLPNLAGMGLAGLTPIVELEMRWPRGTVHNAVAGDPVLQLQLIYQLWTHIQERYAGGSFVAKAKAWGVSPGVALYAFHGFLGGAQRATGPGSHLADASNDPQGAYSGNRGLDIGAKGFISVADLAARVKGKVAAVLGDPKALPVWRRAQSIDELPQGTAPTLTTIFRAIRPAWRALTGTDVRIDATPISAFADILGEGAASSAPGSAAMLMLIGAAGLLAAKLLSFRL